jgi:solute carrier family 25 phosphate transporter 23/24/25/41
MPESAVKFLVYERLKTLVLSDGQYTDADAEALTIGQRLLCGSVAGGVSQLAVYPLDFTKTRLAASTRGTYSGIIDCISRTVRNEGVLAMYRGVVPALGSIVPAVGVELAMYNTLKDMYLKREWEKLLEREKMVDAEDAAALAVRRRSSRRPRSCSDRTGVEAGDGVSGSSAPTVPILTSLAFGAVSAVSGAVIAYPLALTRTKLMTQGMPGRPVLWTGAADCIVQTVRHQGFVGLYRGQVPSLLKTVPAIAIGYSVFEGTKGFLEHRREMRSRSL